MSSENPENKTNLAEFDKELANIFSDCLKIYRLCRFDAEDQKKIKEIFSNAKLPYVIRNEAERENLTAKILDAARLLRYSVIPDARGGGGNSPVSLKEAEELTSRLYELALSQTVSVKQKQVILRETVFFYLFTKNAEKFLKSFNDLIILIKNGPAEEYRATFFAVGLAQILIGDPQPAEITFRRMLRTFSDSDEGGFGLAISLLIQGKKANADSKAKLILTPELLEIYTRLAAKESLTAFDVESEIKNLDLKND